MSDGAPAQREQRRNWTLRAAITELRDRVREVHRAGVAWSEQELDRTERDLERLMERVRRLVGRKTRGTAMGEKE
jgi:ubiquinone biosynthesis protein UbiJ